MSILLGLVFVQTMSHAIWADSGRPIEVSVDIKPMQIIGPLKMGLICGPAGKLRWKDVARESDEDIAQQVANVIDSQRIKKTGSNDRPAPLIKIIAANLKLCVPWKGLLGRPKGSGFLTVRWLENGGPSALEPLAKDYIVPLKIDGRDPREDPSIVSEAVVNLARKIVIEQD